MTIARHVKHASLALIALSSVGALQSAYAVGTPSGTTISNQATVDYSVGGVSQTQITSAAASFVVDSRIDLTVSEVSTNATQTKPGQTNVVTAFRVSNTGNSTQGYQLSVANEASGATLFVQTDNQNVNNLRIFVDSNGNGTYEAGTDAATNINSLITDADGESVVVFVVGRHPGCCDQRPVRQRAPAGPCGRAGHSRRDAGRRRRRAPTTRPASTSCSPTRAVTPPSRPPTSTRSARRR